MITKSQLKYLQTIHQLDPEGNGLKSVEIARVLNVTRTSVHTMLTRLEELELVSKSYYGLVYLQQKGRELVNE